MIFKIKYLLRQESFAREERKVRLFHRRRLTFSPRNNNKREVFQEIFQLKSLNPFLMKAEMEIFRNDKVFFLSRVACEQREVFLSPMFLAGGSHEELRTQGALNLIANLKCEKSV